MTRPASVEINKLISGAFAVACDRILADGNEKKNQMLGRVRRTGNSGGYLPALTKCGAEHVKAMILARADAYVEAFTLYGVPSDEQAEIDLQTVAQQIAAGSISNIRGYLQLRSARLRTVEAGLDLPWHLEIERAMDAALKEGVLKLRRQRAQSARDRQAQTAMARDERLDMISRKLEELQARSSRSSIIVTTLKAIAVGPNLRRKRFLCRYLHLSEPILKVAWTLREHIVLLPRRFLERSYKCARVSMMNLAGCSQMSLHYTKQTGECLKRSRLESRRRAY